MTMKTILAFLAAVFLTAAMLPASAATAKRKPNAATSIIHGNNDEAKVKSDKSNGSERTAHGYRDGEDQTQRRGHEHKTITPIWRPNTVGHVKSDKSNSSARKGLDTTQDPAFRHHGLGGLGGLGGLLR